MTDLKTLALAATCGMWECRETRVYLPSNAGGFDIRNSPNAENNAAYIAAASPDAIMKLLAERDRLREALQTVITNTYEPWTAISARQALEAKP